MHTQIFATTITMFCCSRTGLCPDDDVSYKCFPFLHSALDVWVSISSWQTPLALITLADNLSSAPSSSDIACMADFSRMSHVVCALLRQRFKSHLTCLCTRRQDYRILCVYRVHVVFGCVNMRQIST